MALKDKQGVDMWTWREGWAPEDGDGEGPEKEFFPSTGHVEWLEIP